MTVKLTDKPIAIAADHRDAPSENRPPSPETLFIEAQRLTLICWLLEGPTSKISRTEHPHQ